MKIADDAALVHTAGLASHSAPMLVHRRFRARARARNFLVVVAREMKPQDRPLLSTETTLIRVGLEKPFESTRALERAHRPTFRFFLWRFRETEREVRENSGRHGLLE